MATLLKNIIARPSTLASAWKLIKHRPDSRGYDNQTIKDFELNINRELKEIRGRIISGSYEFIPLKGVAIPKKVGSGLRPLKIPAVRDRVAQKAIEMTISKHIKRKYNIENQSSFAYIKRRSTRDAIEKVKTLYRKGLTWAYMGDIKCFFDSVDLDILLNEYIFPALPDDSINELIQSALKTELGNKAELEKLAPLVHFPEGGVGIPQGCVLSPLFANVYLCELDETMINSGFEMVRYADDFIVMCRTKSEAYEADRVARGILEKKLRLVLHPLKSEEGKFSKDEKFSIVLPFKDQEFLGIRFRGPRIYPGKKQFKKMRGILSATHKSLSGSFFEDLNYLKEEVDYWGVTYHYTDYDKSLYEDLDKRLIWAVNNIVKKYGLRFSRKKGANIEQLNRLGLETFTQRFNYHKIRLAREA